MGVPVVIWGLAATPFLWMILFWSLVLRARLRLGYWPAPYHPDPKDIGFVAHYYLLVGTFPLSLGAAAIVTGVVLLRHRALLGADMRPLWAPVLASAGCAVLLLWGWTDPGRFLYWFGD